MAPGQNSRLLSPADLDAYQAAASSTAFGSLLLAILTIISGVMIFRTTKAATLILAAGFVLMIVPVVVMGYQITAPFLILGVVAIAASAFVGMIFDRARKLQPTG